MATINRRGVARRFIPEMLRMGWATPRIGDFLKLAGISYRRTSFLDDIREFAGRERKRDPLQAIPKKYKPTWDTIELSEYRQVAKFNYNYKITGFDQFKQANVEDWITVASDDLLSMEEAAAEAKNLLEKYKSELVVERMSRDSVTTNIGQAKT